MTYEGFEQLPVWRAAADLYEAAETLLENDAFHVSRGFRDQLDRAALSVSNNIAEGFERGTTNELLSFLSIARGSAGEVRSMLTVAERKAVRLNWPANLRTEISNLKSLAESCSRQLRAWADSLPNSEIKGQRHVSSGTPEAMDPKKRAAQLDKTIKALLPPHPVLRRARKQ